MNPLATREKIGRTSLVTTLCNRHLAVAATLSLSVLASISAVSCREVDLGLWAKGLPTQFAVSGMKSEPTYLERVNIWRDGDEFGVIGGAPMHLQGSMQAVVVSQSGTITPLACPQDQFCGDGSRAGGFLSTAKLVAFSRQNRLHGTLAVRRFGTYEVICVPSENLGITGAILDPCFELNSGATVAQLHRTSNAFDGPSLNPTPLKIESLSSSPLSSPSSQNLVRKTK